MTVDKMSEKLDHYLEQLRTEELSRNTITKYERDIRFFLDFNRDNKIIGKKEMIDYKYFLMTHYKVNTVNSYLISVNRYLTWLGLCKLSVKTLQVQQRVSLDNIITYEEYRLMLRYCEENGRQRDYLLLRTITATGIRVGELRYITCEAAKRGGAEIYSKGKCRQIVMPGQLSNLLLAYCEKENITKGIIFSGRRQGEPLCPKSVWRLLKRIGLKAGVDAKRVYPHNFRHLFARTYMKKIGEVFELADILGHSRIETTRIYAVSSQAEKRRSLDLLNL